MERIEEVDAEGNVLGIYSKDELKKRMFMHKGSLVIPKSVTGKYIFSKRATDQEPFPDTWVCGIGGKVMFGETYHEAAVREGIEEAGVSLELEEVCTCVYDRDDYKARFKVFTSTSGIDIKELVRDPREIQYFAEFSLGEIIEMVKERPEEFAPTFRVAIREFVKRVDKL